MAEIVGEALDLIKSSEGYHRRLADGRAAPYLCPANVWTIGWGSTRDAANGPVARTTPAITPEEAEALFLRDVAIFEALTRAAVKVPLSENQIGALTSFTYNLGLGRLRSSTLLRRVNEGRLQEAADEFPKWVMGGGQRLPGLVIRRERERLLFLKPDQALAPPAPSGTAGGRSGTQPQALQEFFAAFRRAFSGAGAPGK